MAVRDLLETLQDALADRYDVEREIGRGGMACVYLAQDLRHRRGVAIKVLHPHLGVSLGAERFLREIEIAAQLTHPHILPLHESGEVDGLLYYVMPYIAGGSLRDRLARERQLPVDDAVRIVREVADALAYAHAEGVVHRDIKPENILLAGEHALVADFGIAIAIHRAVAAVELTQPGFMAGTRAYASPEQASGSRGVDGRSDVYSLGCVLYEILAGVSPADSSGARPTTTGVPARTPGLRQIRSALPASLEHVIDRALAPIPADRFPDARAFSAALANALPATSGLTASRARWWSWWSGAIAVAVTLVVAFFIIARHSPDSAPLDESQYLVVPFDHVNAAAPAVLRGEECQLLLYDALARWDGVRLVDQMRARDARARVGGTRLTLTDALATARFVGAGRVAWGEVWELGDSIRVRATLYSTEGSGSLLREHRVTIARDLSNAAAKFNELADSLLVGGAGPRAAAEGAGGTKSLAALEAYGRGHAALDVWNLTRAEQEFRAATEVDPEYPHAYLWLAEVMSWSGQPSSRWRGVAAHAVASAQRLAPRDRALAEALLATADRRAPEACARYRALLARDTLDFAAWYGLGDCQSRDPLVLRDSASPSGWRFRSSLHSAINAYIRALEITPSFHLAYRAGAFERLSLFLFTDPARFRRGYALDPDTVWFAAYPALDHDTLAFVPRPEQTVLTGPAARSATLTDAIVRNRSLLRRLTSTWVRAFPNSPGAYESHALALEAEGEIAGADAGGAESGVPSALTAVARARALASEPDQRLRLGVMHVRLLIKAARFEAARTLADSLIAATPDPTSTAAAVLAGLAALTGHVHQSANLLRRAAPDFAFTAADGQGLTPPAAVSTTALALLAYASFGVPADSVIELSRRAQSSISSWVEPRRQPIARAAMLGRPFSLAFRQLGGVLPRDVSPAGDYLLETQVALARGDTAAVRARLARLRAQGGRSSLVSVSLDAAYQEALLMQAIGDTTDAAAWLTAALSPLPRLKSDLLEDVPAAAALVRAMLLRAELAARGSDEATAERWLARADTLWSGADPELRQMVDRGLDHGVDHTRARTRPARRQ